MMSGKRPAGHPLAPPHSAFAWTTGQVCVPVCVGDDSPVRGEVENVQTCAPSTAWGFGPRLGAQSISGCCLPRGLSMVAPLALPVWCRQSSL